MKSFDKLILKANILIANKNYEKALSLLNKTLKQDKNNPEIYTRLSIIYDFLQDYKKSKEMLEKSLEIDPNYPRAHYLKGIDLENERKLKQAEKEYLIAIKNYPKYNDPLKNEHLSEAHTNLGTVYYGLGQYENAVKEWRLGFIYDKNNKEAKNNLKEFSKPFKEKIKEKNFEYFLERGINLLEQDRLSESIRVLKKAYSLKPKNILINYNIGLVYGKLNDFKNASKHLKKFLRLAPSHKEAHKIKELVKKIDEGYFDESI